MNTAATLTSDLEAARILYQQKRDHFRGLSSLYKEHVPQWERMDRSPGRKGNQVFSVYKHRASKGEHMIVLTM
jgi:hypothetical protein